MAHQDSVEEGRLYYSIWDNAKDRFWSLGGLNRDSEEDCLKFVLQMKYGNDWKAHITESVSDFGLSIRTHKLKIITWFIHSLVHNYNIDYDT